MPDEDIQENQVLYTDEDTTSQNGFDEGQHQEEDSDELDPQTLLAQKKSWRKKAVDETTGKTYKELYEEATKSKEQPKPEPQKEEDKPTSDTNDDLVRARLEARGFLDEGEQDIIIKASKALGLSPFQAANDDIVKAKIDAMRQEQKTNNAIPTPSGKAGTQKHDVDYYIGKDELPDDPEMFAKVQAELVRRSKENLTITNSND